MRVDTDPKLLYRPKKTQIKGTDRPLQTKSSSLRVPSAYYCLQASYKFPVLKGADKKKETPLMIKPQILRQATSSRSEKQSLFQIEKKGGQQNRKKPTNWQQKGGRSTEQREEEVGGAKVQLILPEGGGINGVSRRFQDSSVVPLQVLAAHLDGHLVIVAKL